jgi:hypothetical protein
MRLGRQRGGEERGGEDGQKDRKFCFHVTQAPRRNTIVETNPKSQIGTVQIAFRTFVILISDLFRNSKFGFQISTVMVGLRLLRKLVLRYIPQPTCAGVRKPGAWFVNEGCGTRW